MTKQLVTILVPHYKTLKLTKLCLRLIRKHTDLNKAHVIVIDNDSQDESTEYLRTLPWIEFIERRNIPGDPPPVSHGLALDLALERIKTPYVLSIHTDTLIKRKDWLEYILKHIEDKPNVAGVGSWKLESKPWHKRVLKHIERVWQRFWFKITGKKHRLRGIGDNKYYLRGHCSIYRMDLIKKYGLTFADGRVNPGEVMHHKLVKHGHDMLFLPSETLGQYVDHVNHATVVLNPKLGSRKKTIDQGLKRIQKVMDQLQAKQVLADDNLDK
jgi:hypothetical protein